MAELYQRALAIKAKAYGEHHPGLARLLNNLADLYKDQNKHTDAEEAYRRALAIVEKSLGANHPRASHTLDNLAALRNRAGDTAQALAYSRLATARIVAYAAEEAEGGQRREGSGSLVETRASYFRNHVLYLRDAARKGLAPELALADEALEMAQWTTQSAAAAAVQQMAARFAAGSGALANLVRESQELPVMWRDRDAKLLALLSKPTGKEDRATIETLRKEMADIERRIGALNTQLEKEFPDYAALASPKPLKVAEVQQLLGQDEALVFWLTGGPQTYVFALSREVLLWQTIRST